MKIQIYGLLVLTIICTVIHCQNSSDSTSSVVVNLTDIQESNGIKSIDALFENLTFVYVTSNQLDALASYTYNSINNVNITNESFFKQKFINGLMDAGANGTYFEFVDFDTALTYLSGYSFASRLNVNATKSAASKIFSVNKTTNRIEFTTVFSDLVSRSTVSCLNASDNKNKGFLNRYLCDESFKKLNASWLDKPNATHEDQLDDINKIFEDDIEWEVNGNTKVVPSALKVVKLQRSSSLETFKLQLTSKRTLIAELNNLSETVDEKDGVTQYEILNEEIKKLHRRLNTIITQRST